MSPSPLFAAVIGVTCAFCVGTSDAADSAIKRVTLYPGVAAVERVTSVTTAMNEVKFTCLPLTFDSNSLRVDADEGIRFGDISVRTVEAALAPSCGIGPHTPKIRELEDKRAQIDAERVGHEIALNYVKSLGAPVAGAVRTTTESSAIDAITDSMRRAAMNSLIKQQQLGRQLEELDGQLAVLRAQNQTGAKKAAQYREVLIRVAVSKSGALRLNYQVSGPGWTPSYRATLDSASNTVRMERLALVSQNSGEDWAGVQLKLATTQPRQNVMPPMPQPWQIDLLPPVVAPIDRVMSAPAMAPMAVMSRSAEKTAGPSFDASVFEGTYSTEFSIAQPVDLASNDQRTSLSLGTQSIAARVFSRIVPSQAASAFVMAGIKRPEGVWIRGDLQLFRDNALVGNSTWNVGSETDITLAFGRDESLRVSVDPEKKNTSTAGFTGGKQVHTYARAFSIENLRKTTANIEVIEASPVAVNAEVDVQSRFAPEPTQKDWKAMRGVNSWTQSLSAGQSATFKADYTVTYPKDMRVMGLR